jgi:uncharacterized membrane protein YqhA
MGIRNLERRFSIAIRLTTLLAVLASSVGAVLMLIIGFLDTIAAVVVQFEPETAKLPASDATSIHLISSLDRFLMAIVLLYFAYGIYILFVRPEGSSEELGIPKWLKVEGIGELKQTLAEVIIIVLFVLFLRVALETFIAEGPDLTWPAVLELLTLPTAILLLSASLRLAQLHPKVPRSPPRD